MRKIYNTFLRRILHKLYLEKYAIYINCWYLYTFLKRFKGKNWELHFKFPRALLCCEWGNLSENGVEKSICYFEFYIFSSCPMRSHPKSMHLFFGNILPSSSKKFLLLREFECKVVVQLFFKKPARDALKMQTWYR